MTIRLPFGLELHTRRARVRVFGLVLVINPGARERKGRASFALEVRGAGFGVCLDRPARCTDPVQ